MDIRERLQQYREREQAERIRKEEQKREEHRQTWQRYGGLEIKRAGWKRRPDGIWEVEAQRIGEPYFDIERMAVDCRNLKINQLQTLCYCLGQLC
jgi:hypothetical protein